MLRPSRPFALALLWLMLVLAPLRGFAESRMHLPAPEQEAPCHAAVAMHHAAVAEGTSAGHGGAAAGNATASGSMPAGCNLCDLCNGGAIEPPPALSLTDRSPAGAAPNWADRPTPAGSAEPPFRPPRG